MFCPSVSKINMETPKVHFGWLAPDPNWWQYSQITHLILSCYTQKSFLNVLISVNNAQLYAELCCRFVLLWFGTNCNQYYDWVIHQNTKSANELCAVWKLIECCCLGKTLQMHIASKWNEYTSAKDGNTFYGYYRFRYNWSFPYNWNINFGSTIIDVTFPFPFPLNLTKSYTESECV